MLSRFQNIYMNLIAKKSLGQHFLKSASALQKILEAARIENHETVFEIGPGTGILTDELLLTSAHVIAVEKDDRAYALLQEKYATEITTGKLELIHGDILAIDREKIGLKDKHYAVVANIPYYITGAILESFLEYEPRPDRMVLLVQKEVAERIVARSGKESILSVSVKAFGTPRIVAAVPRGAFVPPPTVDSAIIEICDIGKNTLFGKEDGKIESKKFFSLVKTAFAHKRKYALRNLEVLYDKKSLETAWEQVKLPPNVRAEDISVEKWSELTHFLHKEQKVL